MIIYKNKKISFILQLAEFSKREGFFAYWFSICKQQCKLK